MAAQKPRLLTGDRPTGPLHLGHWVGSLQNRIAAQSEHEVFLIVADLHSLTTRPHKTEIADLSHHVRDVVLDLLSVGIDPETSTIYLQSGVAAVYDLAILLAMVTPAAALQEVEATKAMAKVAGLSDKDMSFGLLGYPVLQAADILMARAEIVPVGGDNVANVELARAVAERFNSEYGEVFPLPKAVVSNVPMLPGVGDDHGAAKMSKSAGNVINLKDSPQAVRDKLGALEGERLEAFVAAFVDDPEASSASEAAARQVLQDTVDELLAPMRERRASVAADTGLVEEILVDGTIRAREVAYKTLQDVRNAMGLEDLWQGLVGPTEARAAARKKPY